MKIVLDRIECATDQPVHGLLCLDLGSVHFPDAQWNDFVLIVLAWWMEQASSLANGAARAEFRFMDGPFAFSLHRQADGQFDLLLSRSKGVMDESGLRVTLPGFLAELSGAAASLLKSCQAAGHDSLELRRMDELLGALKASRSRYG